MSTLVSDVGQMGLSGQDSDPKGSSEAGLAMTATIC